MISWTHIHDQHICSCADYAYLSIVMLFHVVWGVHPELGYSICVEFHQKHPVVAGKTTFNSLHPILTIFEKHGQFLW